MFGFLEVVIGIVFVLLLLSLLAMTVMELISSFFSLRGKNLEKALRNMLASSDNSEKLFKEFRDNSMYRQLSQRSAADRRRAPSYLSDESFTSILFDIVLQGDKVDQLIEKIESLPDNDLKNVLKQLLNDAEYELGDFKGKIREWYNDVMDRASGWYKRFVQKITVVVGLLIAIIFNADTLAIYDRMESDPQTVQQVVTMAEEYLSKQSPDEPARVTPTFEQQLDDIRGLINNEIEEAKSPLGLGWSEVDVMALSWQQWGMKVLGWMVTSLAISLGAPFWFDLLRKLVNIRSSGSVPKSE